MDDKQLLQSIAKSVENLNDKVDLMQGKLSDYQVKLENRLTTTEVKLGEVCTKVANIKPSAFKSNGNGTSQAVTLTISKVALALTALLLLVLGGVGKEVLAKFIGGG
jgi:transcriptional regulator with GAF, ATPase, and Fis domain